jgi:hypothetical protein
VFSVIFAVVKLLMSETCPVTLPVNEPVIVPVTPNVPVMLWFPATVKSSPMATVEVVCPILTVIPLVSVATFKAPCELVIYECVPS